MATLTLTSSGWDAGQIRITYTASNGTLKITEIEGKRGDGYRSYNENDTAISISVGGTSKSISLSHYVDFGASGWVTWGAADTSWTGLSGTSIKVSTTMQSGTPAYSGYTFTGNATMSWTTYTIAYNANGGSGAPSSQTKTHGTNLTISSTKPTRTGYTFKGWALTKADADDGNWYYSSGSTCGKNENLTLYAVWEEHYLTINYYSNYADYGTYENAALNVSASSNIVVLTHKYYYDNAYTDGLYNIQNSSKLYLTRTGYSSTLNWGTSPSGGTLIDQATSFSTGQALAEKLGTSLKTGNPDPINLYAQWDANSYTYNIVYKSSSGVQLGTATVAKDYGTTNTVTPKAFNGYTSPSSQSVKWDSTSAKTITFTYTPITYNVTINCNGGSGVSSRTYNVETATFTLGTPTRTGYTFNGWTGSNGTTAQKTVSVSKGSTGDKAYTAQWTENKLTISYYSNYATSAFEDALNTVGADKNVEVYRSQINYDDDYSTYGLANYSGSGESAYMTKTGYTPTGYWQTSDGKSIHEDNKSFTTGQSLAQALGKDISKTSDTVNVYAQWRPNILTIKFHANGGKVNSEEYYIDNDLISLISSSSVLEDEWTYNDGHSNGLYNASTFGLTHEGYDFLGWKVGSTGTTIFDQDDGSVLPTDLASNITTGDRTITLYAVWGLSGVVYIDNGTTFEPYLPYIDNGSTWDLYMAYIDDGTEWIAIS